MNLYRTKVILSTVNRNLFSDYIMIHTINGKYITHICNHVFCFREVSIFGLSSENIVLKLGRYLVGSKILA